MPFSLVIKFYGNINDHLPNKVKEIKISITQNINQSKVIQLICCKLKHTEYLTLIKRLIKMLKRLSFFILDANINEINGIFSRDFDFFLNFLKNTKK